MMLYLQDMPASNNTLFYMFQNLAPAREYEVSVSMRNAIGEGPRAYVTISTPPLPTRMYPEQSKIEIVKILLWIKWIYYVSS